MLCNITTSCTTIDNLVTEEVTSQVDFIVTMTTENGDFRQPASIVVLEVVIAIVMWVLSVLGNTLVCIVIQRSKRLQSTTNYFVVSLASADHVFTFTVMPFVFLEIINGGWTLGIGMCKLTRTLLHWTPGVTMLILICICIDRYYTILYPLCFKITRKRAKRMIAVSWLVALGSSLPALYFYNTSGDDDGLSYCIGFIDSHQVAEDIPGVVYTVIYTTLLYIIPALILLVGYIKIFRYIWRIGIGGRTLQRTTNPVPRTKVKMVKLIMVVNGSILFLVSPYFIAHLWHCSVRSDVTPSVFITVVYVYFASVCVKPGLYLCYNSNFRRGCREVFCTSTMKCYRKNIYTVTTVSKYSRKNHVGIIQTDTPNVHPTRPETPSKTFNRARNVEQSVWPLGNSAPSTYL